jgi:hypothetical protein
MPLTYTPIATQTLGSSASTVTFSSISGSYTDLVMVISAFTGNDVAEYTMRLNGDSGTNYSVTSLEGAGSVAVSQRQSTQPQMYLVGFQGGTYTEPFTTLIHFMNYSNTTTNKTILSRSSSNAASAYCGLWRSTAAINTIAITTPSSTFSTNTTFSLYGILAA